jgi:hypothetical protein
MTNLYYTPQGTPFIKYKSLREDEEKEGDAETKAQAEGRKAREKAMADLRNKEMDARLEMWKRKNQEYDMGGSTEKKSEKNEKTDTSKNTNKNVSEDKREDKTGTNTIETRKATIQGSSFAKGMREQGAAAARIKAGADASKNMVNIPVMRKDPKTGEVKAVSYNINKNNIPYLVNKVDGYYQSNAATNPQRTKLYNEQKKKAYDEAGILYTTETVNGVERVKPLAGSDRASLNDANLKVVQAMMGSDPTSEAMMRSVGMIETGGHGGSGNYNTYSDYVIDNGQDEQFSVDEHEFD